MSTVTTNADLDEFNRSILEFLNKERECFKENLIDENSSDLDVESIFEEINRLSDKNDERSVEEILREAECLMKNQILNNKQYYTESEYNKNCVKIENNCFKKVVDEVLTASVLSDESTPHVDDSHSDNDEIQTIEEITGGIETIQFNMDKNQTENDNDDSSSTLNNKTVLVDLNNMKIPVLPDLNNKNSGIKDALGINNRNRNDQNKIKSNPLTERNEYKEHRKSFDRSSIVSPININNKIFSRPSSTQSTYSEKSYANKLNLSHQSPSHSLAAQKTSLENISVTREHALKMEIEQLQEKLKDTEERLQSLKIQHDSLSQIHRDLRENHTQIQEESEHLKLDVQHLTECANVLRSELQSARKDRNEALEIQKTLQNEIDECKSEKKILSEQSEKDSKIIQDLKRQCKEMERILMRKHPDSVSALIVASKNPTKGNEDSPASRRLLEQRIAQLEADAKQQDIQAQKILANVQAKFNSVQAKYETHIADLETQVLSLQEINTKLNEKIEFQIATLNNFAKSNNHFKSSCTQTEDIPERESKMITMSTQTDIKLSGKLGVTSGPSTGAAKKNFPSKIPSSHSETQIPGHYGAGKEDAHLLATIRGMRVDLAIKDKAMQRLTKELEECKKTIRKLQKEKDVMKLEKSNTAKRHYDPHQYVDQQNSSDSQALKEALNKIKLLEFDYKALHDKRLQDLKTLQAAHERELASCHETVRILQQRLTERDEAFANQKRRKVPIDYYALKAKVTSLERRHSEREQRLHMLVEALSKGRLNGALEDILTENDK
ncbi:centrosomal protein of 162 kDa [Condylostylus longicornis]|uniref:centrosomal protein of 162 kDa n=1 Tax=Condylostylus longicornis TaxID=2530218 RepID=UPI00244DDBBD|nr:centrosomal protein of 162 kDa [Condylostylus longicornis]